jgi:hypothetical protein
MLVGNFLRTFFKNLNSAKKENRFPLSIDPIDGRHATLTWRLPKIKSKISKLMFFLSKVAVFYLYFHVDDL